MDVPSSGDLKETTPEGRAMEYLLQIISEPTTFEPNKKPSCIDIVTAQPKPWFGRWYMRLSILTTSTKHMTDFPWIQHLNLNIDIN